MCAHFVHISAALITLGNAEVIQHSHGHAGKNVCVMMMAGFASRPSAVLVSFAGASCADDGRLEGKFTVDYLFCHFRRLWAFEAFHDVPEKELRQLLIRSVLAETKSQNTVEARDRPARRVVRPCGRVRRLSMSTVRTFTPFERSGAYVFAVPVNMRAQARLASGGS